MDFALPASDAVVGLSFTGYSPLVVDKEMPACIFVFRVSLVGYYISFIETVVVEEEYGRYVDAVWTRHTVLAVGAGYDGVADVVLCDMLKQLQLVVRELLMRAEGAQVVLQVVHVCHAAQ